MEIVTRASMTTPTVNTDHGATSPDEYEGIAARPSGSESPSGSRISETGQMTAQILALHVLYFLPFLLSVHFAEGYARTIEEAIIWPSVPRAFIFWVNLSYSTWFWCGIPLFLIADGCIYHWLLRSARRGRATLWSIGISGFITAITVLCLWTTASVLIDFMAEVSMKSIGH